MDSKTILQQPYKSLFTGGIRGWPENTRVETFSKDNCRNVFLRLDGSISPTPFNAGKDGMWYFDGQFYSQRAPMYLGENI